ncbi:MAG: RidA family protein [Gammaproteobacteria bacterium]
MHQTIQTEEAPQAIGPYSQAIKVGNMVFVSGQIPLHPETKEMVSGDIVEEIKQVFENLNAIAKAANAGLHDIVKLTIYLTDLNFFPQVNDMMTHYFSAPFPARATIGVSALPKGARVEMDAIIMIPTE